MGQTPTLFMQSLRKIRGEKTMGEKKWGGTLRGYSLKEKSSALINKDFLILPLDGITRSASYLNEVQCFLLLCICINFNVFLLILIF